MIVHGILNLNKKKNKKSVVSKLNMLGYKINYCASIRDIQNIVKIIQKKNGLIADGYIGIRTMPLLGYRIDEIMDLLPFYYC